MAASRVKYNAAAGTVALTAGTSQYTLAVVDWVAFCFVQPATAVDATLQIGDSAIVARKRGADAQGDYIFVEFSGGFPLWSADDSMAAPDATVTITGACTGGTFLTCAVGYHHENPATRKRIDG